MTTENNTPDILGQIIAEHDDLTSAKTEQQPPHFTGKDWQGRSVILTHKATGQAVRRSHSHPTFRGEHYRLIDARPPHKEGAAGFVYPEGGGELYASVFDMKWSKA